jgi:hypothetical protein
MAFARVRGGRRARVEGATLIATRNGPSHRLKADVLEIEAQAARKLADEYDGAQERGEVVSAHSGATKRVPDENAFSPATAADIGLSRARTGPKIPHWRFRLQILSTPDQKSAIGAE